MLRVGARRRWLVMSLATVVVGMFVGLALVAWSFVKYPSATQRTAAGHLDKVSVDKADYLGEDTSNNDAVSRFWIRRGTSAATPLPNYKGQQLRQDDPLSRSRFEEELGWLSMAKEEMPCDLTAYRVIRVNASTGVDLSTEDKSAIESGRATLIRVVVTCGGG